MNDDEQERDTRFVLDTLHQQARHELKRQYGKWGHQDHAIGDWWLIVSEEFGELAKAALEGNSVGIMEEAGHLVACIARFAEKAGRDVELKRLTSDGWAAR